MDETKLTHEYSEINKWITITELTISNYANMLKRLNSKASFSSFVLIYYSIFLIVTTLTQKYFPTFFNCTVGEYFGLIFSIIILVYSLINKNARYSERIQSLEFSLNRIKSIRRSFNSTDLLKQIKEYDEIVDNTEIRNDIDFFNTLKTKCRQNNVLWFMPLHMMKIESTNKELIKLKEYLSQINRFSLQLEITISKLMEMIIVLIPIFVWGFMYINRM